MTDNKLQKNQIDIGNKEIESLLFVKRKARLMCMLSKTRNLIYATLKKGVLTIHSVRLVNGKVQRHRQHIQFGRKENMKEVGVEIV